MYRFSKSCTIINHIGFGITSNFPYPSSSPMKYNKNVLYSHFKFAIKGVPQNALSGLVGGGLEFSWGTVILTWIVRPRVGPNSAKIDDFSQLGNATFVKVL